MRVNWSPSVFFVAVVRLIASQDRRGTYAQEFKADALCRHHNHIPNRWQRCLDEMTTASAKVSKLAFRANEAQTQRTET